MSEIILGILMPFAGTAVGSAFSFFAGKKINENADVYLSGFASGVMIAASVWSLIIPSIEMSENYGSLSFLPSAVGITAGMAFVLLLTKFTENKFDKIKKKNFLLFLSVTLHNIPEGMAVGAAYALSMLDNDPAALVQACLLSFGISVQNIPEGAIISLPLRSEGKGRLKSAMYGVASGIVEPIASVITIMLVHLALPLLPYLLSFAAGTMICVVLEELIPQSRNNEKNNKGTIAFVVGFLVMMCLDVALG